MPRSPIRRLGPSFRNLGVVPLPMTPAAYRQISRGRNREMGQGDPGGQHQGGIKSRSMNPNIGIVTARQSQ